MKIRQIYNELHPGITMHKIPVKAGFAGLIFTVGTLTVFLIGIPALVYFLALACVGHCNGGHAPLHPSIFADGRKPKLFRPRINASERES